jgi:hypothetical protein
VADGAIATLTIVYDPAWEQQKVLAQAAPIRTAQALATARATRTAAAAPGTQDRRMPSAGPWIAAAGPSLLGVLALALGSTFGRRPGDAA